MKSRNSLTKHFYHRWDTRKCRNEIKIKQKLLFSLVANKILFESWKMCFHSRLVFYPDDLRKFITTEELKDIQIQSSMISGFVSSSMKIIKFLHKPHESFKKWSVLHEKIVLWVCGCSLLLFHVRNMMFSVIIIGPEFTFPHKQPHLCGYETISYDEQWQTIRIWKDTHTRCVSKKMSTQLVWLGKCHGWHRFRFHKFFFVRWKVSLRKTYFVSKIMNYSSSVVYGRGSCSWKIKPDTKIKSLGIFPISLEEMWEEIHSKNSQLSAQLFTWILNWWCLKEVLPLFSLPFTIMTSFKLSELYVSLLKNSFETSRMLSDQNTLKWNCNRWRLCSEHVKSFSNFFNRFLFLKSWMGMNRIWHF